MPWTRPTLRALREMFRDDIDAHLPRADARVPHAVLRELGDASAAQTDDMHDHLAHIARMVMPDTAEGEYVERWANIWLADGRKQASQATGAITVSGEVGAALPTGSIFTVGGLTFEVTAGVTLSTTSQDVQIHAIDAGADGNLAAGITGTLEAPPDGITAEATIAAPGMAGGADGETEEALIGRTIEAIQRPAHGGIASDYVMWAKEVAGVTHAWAYGNEMGVGTMTVRVLLADVRAAQNGIPTEADRDLVKAHLDTRRPVTVADLFVPALTAVALDFTITRLAGDTPETRTAIQAEVVDMLRRRAVPGGTIYRSWVAEAISIATGEDSHDLTMSNLTMPSAGHIAVMGTITWPS